MKRKITSIALSIAMLLAVPTTAFAQKDVRDNNLNDVEKLIVEPDSSNVVKEMVEEEDSYSIELSDVKINIPKDGTSEIETVLDNGDVIGMGLPEEVAVRMGEECDGIVEYEGGDVAVYSQVGLEENDDLEWAYNRLMIKIDNNEAPHEYTYKFDMPEGYRIMSDTDFNMERRAELVENREKMLAVGISESEYNEMISQFDVTYDEVYIVDDNDLVRQVIESPWAKDANGNSLDTDYAIEGNCLVQHIEFDSNTVFPIIADPKVGTTKSFSLKISNDAMGMASFAGGTLSSGAKKVIKSKVKKKIIAVVGSKFVPGLSIASWAMSGLAVINYATGKKGIKISGTMIYRRHYSEKEGYAVEGWDIKSLKASRY